jgi:hypothetical protein
MNEVPNCRQCGAVPKADALGGICPRCLVELGIAFSAQSQQPAVASDNLPRRFGDYELLEEIARGGALADELDRFLKSEPIQARRIGALGKTWRWCRRKPALASVGALAALLLFTLAIGGQILIGAPASPSADGFTFSQTEIF